MFILVFVIVVEGVFWEDFFIDFVDIEFELCLCWCGWWVFVVGGVCMEYVFGMKYWCELFGLIVVLFGILLEIMLSILFCYFYCLCNWFVFNREYFVLVLC